MSFLLCLFLTQSAALTELVAAERAFARNSEETTTQQAFLAVLADSGILFRAGPVNGLEFVRANPFPPGGLLRWRPLVADVAESGEIGYTTGPFESGPRGEAPRGRGYFVSVWERSSNGPWRLKVDLGISSPAALPVDQADAAFRRAARMPGPRSAAGATAADLQASDRRFAQMGTSAYDQLLADSVRLYRAGHEPTTTRATALELLRSLPTASTWATSRAVVARSGDFGYTWGTYAGTERGSYVRLWRRTDDRGWLIVLDITNANP
jgi:hypothetical protein